MERNDSKLCQIIAFDNFVLNLSIHHSKYLMVAELVIYSLLGYDNVKSCE